MTPCACARTPTSSTSTTTSERTESSRNGLPARGPLSTGCREAAGFVWLAVRCRHRRAGSPNPAALGQTAGSGDPALHPMHRSREGSGFRFSALQILGSQTSDPRPLRKEKLLQDGPHLRREALRQFLDRRQLVDRWRRLRDGIRPSSGNPIFGKFRHRRLQDRGAARLGMPARSQPRSKPFAAGVALGTMQSSRSDRCFHIINQLVRL